MLKLEIIGNLTRDPSTRDVNGRTVCNFTVASSRKTRDGETRTTFVDISAWGKLGEICDQYLAKGRKVYVEGIPSARPYMSKDGSEPRASLEVMANNVEFLSSRVDSDLGGPAPTRDEQTGFSTVDDEELPF